MTTTFISFEVSAVPVWLKIIAVIGVVWYAFGRGPVDTQNASLARDPFCRWQGK